jgi:hypothetical protein
VWLIVIPPQISLPYSTGFVIREIVSAGPVYRSYLGLRDKAGAVRGSWLSR